MRSGINTTEIAVIPDRPELAWAFSVQGILSPGNFDPGILVGKQ
jgi:hypothetical protein